LAKKEKGKKFSQTALLRRLVAVKPICKICKKDAFQVDLTLHHKNKKSNDDRWQNIVIYCRACHNDVEKTRPKSRRI